MPPPPSTHSSAHSYRTALENDCWNKVGQGAGGTVHRKQGENIVVKVSEADDAYLAFVQFASSNPFSCLPVVTPIHQGQNWAVTHIEILNTLKPAAASLVATWWAAYIASKKSNLPLPEPAEWSNMAEALRNVAISNQCCFDIKSENVMQRPDGTIVFTDPLF